MIPPILLYMLPLVILAVGGLIVMLADALQAREGGMAIPTAMLHFAALGAALVLWPMAGDAHHVTEASRLFHNYLAFDRTALFLYGLIALGGGFASLLAGGYLHEHELERGEFYTLLTFASCGAMMLVAASDLLMLFVGLETMSLGVYAMTGFRRTSGRSAEAALKYFLLGSFAAAILLYGAALLYGITGHTDFAGIRAALATPLEMPANASEEMQRFVGEQQTVRERITILSMVLLFVGMAFKVSAVPFHMWTPDAYEGAPTPATAFMSVAVKAAAFGALLRLMLGVFGDPAGAASLAGGWPNIAAWLAVATMTFGNLAALGQTSVKRMLAYSSITHAGYLLLGVVVAPRTELLPGVAGGLTVGQNGVAAVLFYLLGYTVSNIGAFGSLILAGRHKLEAVSFDDLAGLGKRHPGVAFAMSFFVLSLAGVPPFAGFFGKYYVINAALEAGYPWLALAALLNSAIAVYYYLRVMVKMYMHDPAPGAPHAVPMHSGYVNFVLIVAGALVLYIGAMPSRFLQFAVEAVRHVGAP